MKLQDIQKRALEFCLTKIDAFSELILKVDEFHEEEIKCFKRNLTMYQARAYKVQQRLNRGV